MGVTMRDAGGALRQVVGVEMRDAGNVLRDIQSIKVRDAANVLREVFAAMAAAIPTFLRGYGNSSSAVDVTTANAAVTVTGGSGPFTYLWTRTDGGADSWTITLPTAELTAFRANAVDPFDTRGAFFKCTVTDSASKTADSNEIEVSAVNLGGGL